MYVFILSQTFSNLFHARAHLSHRENTRRQAACGAGRAPKNGSSRMSAETDIRDDAIEETVRLTGLEPARRETPDPKSGASTNSATGATTRLRKCGCKGTTNLRTVQIYSDKSFRAVSTMVSSPRR